MMPENDAGEFEVEDDDAVYDQPDEWRDYFDE